jgi:phage/plasmid-associated DNA primase
VLQQQHLRQKEAQQQREREQAREREREAMYAALASQTLLKRLGGAFWEAFSGAEHKDKSGAALASSASSSTSSSSNVGRNWDAEKVRKVLEGKAVVRVVDVEPPSPKLANAAVQTPAATAASPKMDARKCSSTKVAEVLEESMRSLSLGKK